MRRMLSISGEFATDKYIHLHTHFMCLDFWKTILLDNGKIFIIGFYSLYIFWKAIFFRHSSLFRCQEKVVWLINNREIVTFRQVDRWGGVEINNRLNCIFLFHQNFTLHAFSYRLSLKDWTEHRSVLLQRWHWKYNFI